MEGSKEYYYQYQEQLINEENTILWMQQYN
jgi:hypothetical protein